jgi:hypothetical protein
MALADTWADSVIAIDRPRLLPVLALMLDFEALLLARLLALADLLPPPLLERPLEDEPRLPLLLLERPEELADEPRLPPLLLPRLPPLLPPLRPPLPN